MEIEMYKKDTRWRTAFWVVLCLLVAGFLFLQFRGLDNVWRRGYSEGFIKGSTNGFEVGIDTGRSKDCGKMSECSGLWSIQVDTETLEARWVNKGTGEGFIFPYQDYPYTEHDR